MAKQLSLSGIQSGDVIEAEHVTQSIDAFTGAEAYDITVSGSLTMQGPLTGTPETLNSFSASYALTASHALNIATPTLQEVTDAGSITTTPITASIISASNNIITNNLTSSNNILIKGGLLEIKNQGTQSSARFYCEDDNLHYTEIKAQSHSLYTGNKTMLLPSYNFDFITPNFQANITASGNISASGYISASSFNATSLTINQLTASHAMTASFVPNEAIFPFSGSAVITGSLVISSSNQEQSLQLYGSGSTIFSIEGSRGTLFSIDDDESDGTLFSVNNVSGTPVLEVHEDNTVKIGKQDGFGIVISGSNPLPNDNDAKILITGSIHNVGSTAYFDTNITASGNISSSGYISASSFNATPLIINELTASYAVTASHALNVATPTLQTVTDAGNSTTTTITASIISSSANIIAQSFTGSLSGSALEAISSSYALTASYVENAQTASYIDALNIKQPFTNLTSSNLLITGTASINLLYTNYESSSIIYSSGSTKFGDTFDDFHQFTGSISSTGSYVDFTGATGVSGSFSGSFAGDGSELTNIPASGITGLNLSRIASGSVTASIAPNKGFEINTSITASGNISASGYISASEFIGLVTTAQTASYVENAQTASYVETAQTASYVTTAQTASYVETAQTASFITGSNVYGPHGSNSVISSSHAVTASFALTTINPFPYTGSADITGSLGLVGPAIITGSVIISGSDSYNLRVTGNSYTSGNSITAGNVGVGINSPSQKLDVRGISWFSGDSYARLAIEPGTTSQTIHASRTGPRNGQDMIFKSSQYSTGGGRFIFKSNSTENMRLNRGLLGIGTTNPKQRLHVQGNITASGFVSASSFVNNIPGTINQLTASYAVTASHALNVATPTLQIVTDAGSLTTTAITGSNISASGYISASSFNATPSIINELTASYAVTASHALNVATPTLQIVTDAGASTTTAITGSNISASGFISASKFIGLVTTAQTASYVENAQTASFVTNAQTASYVLNAQTASYVENAQTASYVTLAQTASFVTTAQTASYITTAQTASYVLNAVSSSYALTASYAISASHEIIKEVSSSYADTASYVENAQTASFITTAQTASYVLNAVSSSYALTASYAISASHEIIKEVSSSYADTASYVETAQTASYVLNANNATDLVIQVKNTQTSTILKGQVLHSIGVTGENIDVITASNDSATSMPGFAVANQDISSNAAGQAIISGKIKNIDTSGLTAGSNVYVNSNGGYTGTKPSGSSLIQNIGVVGKVNATEGELIILGAGRSNDVPNLLDNQIFFGSGSNQSQQIHISGALDSTIINNITASGNISASGDIISNTGSFNRLEVNDSSLLSGSTIITGSLSVEGPTAITGALFVSASKEQLPDGILMRIGDDNIGPKLEFSQSYDGGIAGVVDSSVFKIRGNENGNSGINLGVAGSAPEVFISTTSNLLSLDTKLQIEKFGSTNIEPQFITRNSHFTWSLYSAASWSIKQYITDYELFQINSAGNVRIGTGSIDTNYLFDVSGSTRLQGNTTAHDIQITGSAIISSSNSTASLTLQSSGSTIFEVQGSQGQLFSVTDDLIHDVLLVNDISGNELFKVSGSGLVEVFEGSITTPQGTINSLTASYAMNIQPENSFMPVATHTTNFTSTSSYAGYYNVVGGNLSITVTTGSSPTDLTPGMEWNFFQTASAGNFTFTAGTGVNILSRNMQTKLAAIGSAGTLKYISDQTFHLIGDLTL